jgi:hypothetical protein
MTSKSYDITNIFLKNRSQLASFEDLTFEDLLHTQHDITSNIMMPCFEQHDIMSNIIMPCVKKHDVCQKSSCHVFNSIMLRQTS